MFLWWDVMKAHDSLRESLTFPLDPDDDVRSEAGENHEAIQQY